MANINEKRLKYLEFVNRENNFRHLRYEEEIRPYLYMKAGDPRALDAYRQLIDSPLVGHLSDDPLRNRKYLFVSAVTLTTRYARKGMGLVAGNGYDAAAVDRHDEPAGIGAVIRTDRCTGFHGITSCFVEKRSCRIATAPFK